jgi:hypothetical protein
LCSFKVRKIARLLTSKICPGFSDTDSCCPTITYLNQPSVVARSYKLPVLSNIGAPSSVFKPRDVLGHFVSSRSKYLDMCPRSNHIAMRSSRRKMNRGDWSSILDYSGVFKPSPVSRLGCVRFGRAHRLSNCDRRIVRHRQSQEKQFDYDKRRSIGYKNCLGMPGA